MFKLLGSLLKSTRTSKTERSLTSIYDLKKGDMLKLADSFALPEDVRGETFRVQQIATYFYAGAGTPQFVLKGSANQSLFLSIEDFDGEELLVLSKELKRREVEQLFGWDKLKKANTEAVKLANEDSSGWCAASYQQRVGGAEGLYFERDLRSHTTPPAGGEPFIYHEYYSEDETKALEVEVWEGNEYEVSIGLVRPFSDIAEYWPASR